MEASSVARCPAELWIKIAIILRYGFPCDHMRRQYNGPCIVRLCTRRTIARPRALSETSRFLHNAVRHILYEAISLFAIDGGRLFTTLTDNHNLAYGVRTLTVFRHAEHPSAPPKFDTLLLRFLGLRSLSVSYDRLTIQDTQLFVVATGLTMLKVTAHGWQKDVPLNWSAGGFGRHLRELELYHIFDEEEQVGDQADATRSSQFFAPGLVSIGCSSARLRGVISALESGATSLHKLVKLTLTISYGAGDKDRLCRLLEHCANLEELEVEDHDAPTTYHFTRCDILPRLRHISSSLSLCNALPPLRRLETVVARALAIEENDDFNLELSITAPVLRSLSISNVAWTKETLSIVAAQCHHITHLTIQFDRCTIDRNILTEVGRFPHLQELFLSDGMGYVDSDDEDVVAGLEEDKAILEDVKASKCPDLMEVMFDNIGSLVKGADGRLATTSREYIPALFMRMP